MPTKKTNNKPEETAAEQTSGEGRSSDPSFIRIQLYRSTIGCNFHQKVLVSSLGLTRLNQVVERPDTASMRGAVRKAPHLLRLVD